VTIDGLLSRIEEIRRNLDEARQKRIHPAKDDKILTDWNGLMIAAFAKASQVLRDESYLKAAAKAAEFLLTKVLKGDLLFHRYVKDERAIEGFLDDYAFLAWGLIEVYEAGFDEKYLKAALQLTETMVVRFWDDQNGGFYSTSKDAADVLVRRKEVYDGALPSGNSVALMNLLRLARLSDNSAYEEKAFRLTRVFAWDVKMSPAAHTFFLLGLDFALGSSYNLIVVGESGWDSTLKMLDLVRKRYVPNLVVSVRTPEKSGFGYEALNGKATAYVCRNQICMPPTNDPAKMLELLGQKS
jgi:uncharacterized protein YyaL (SSP411 family)